MNPRILLLSAAVAVTALLSVLIPRLSRPLEPFEVGLRLLKEGRPTDAVHLFEDPQWRGVAEYRAGRYHRAVVAFSVQRNADALYNLGNAYAHLYTWDGAKAAYREALLLDPSHLDAQHNLDVVIRAEALERQQLADTRDTRKLGRLEDGTKPGEPETSEDEPTKEGNKGAESGEISQTDQRSSRGGQSDSAGMSGDEVLSPDAQGGAAQAEDFDQSEPEVALGSAGGITPLRRESAQAVEVLLRQIKDDPERVLKYRLREIQTRRAEERLQ